MILGQISLPVRENELAIVECVIRPDLSDLIKLVSPMAVHPEWTQKLNPLNPELSVVLFDQRLEHSDTIQDHDAREGLLRRVLDQRDHEILCVQAKLDPPPGALTIRGKSTGNMQF